MKQFLKTSIKAMLAIVTVAVILVAFSAAAQQDPFGQMRTIYLCAPTTLRTDGASKGITNTPVDIHGAMGVGLMNVFVQTNSGVGTLTLTVQASTDLTTWTTLGNCAIAVSNSIIYTNSGPSTAIYATNLTYLPGTITYPTSQSAGFANPYLAPVSFNSNAVITVSTGSGANIYQFGFNAEDCSRYLRTTWVATGANTNYDGIAASLTLRRQNN